MSKPSITNCPNTFFRKFIVSTVFSVHYLVLLVCKYVITHYQVVIAVRSHLFPFRTEKLSSLAPMVLQCGRVGSRLLLSRASDFERFLRLFCFHADWFFLTRIVFFSHADFADDADLWPVRSGISQMGADFSLMLFLFPTDFKDLHRF